MVFDFDEAQHSMRIGLLKGLSITDKVCKKVPVLAKLILLQVRFCIFYTWRRKSKANRVNRTFFFGLPVMA